MIDPESPPWACAVLGIVVATAAVTISSRRISRCTLNPPGGTGGDVIPERTKLVPNMALYLEDLTPGLKIEGGPLTVDEEAAIAFARQFDPQPFHTDPVAALTGFFGGLVLSGWHTAALTMRMLAGTKVSQIVNGLVGLEVRHIRFPSPARPGDTL